MSLSFSSKSRNNSFSSDEDESCFYKHCNSNENDNSLSVSRPLHFTFTMGSGSSGANTTFNSTYGSGSSSFAGTPFSTPPETPGGDVCEGEELAGSRDVKQLGAEFSKGLSARREMNLRLPIESMDILQSQLIRPPRALLGAMHVREATDEDLSVQELEAVSSRELDLELKEVAPWSEGATGGIIGSMARSSPHEEEEMATPLLIGSSLLRSKRPPPLDLSSVNRSPSKTSAFGIGTGGVNVDQIIEVTDSVSLRSAGEDTFRVPHSAPPHKTTRAPSYDLPPMPATAPLLTMPKAPLIRPSIPSFARSPSPLTLPSPGLPFTFDSQPGYSLPTMSPLLLDDSISPLVITSPKFAPGSRQSSVRKVSLGRQMAAMRIGITSPPIPPSLIKSPLITSPSSPFGPTGYGKQTPTWSSHSTRVQSPSRVDRVVTPMRIPMNPYFSSVVPGSYPANIQLSPP